LNAFSLLPYGRGSPWGEEPFKNPAPRRNELRAS
jgi:hypothetical protein